MEDWAWVGESGGRESLGEIVKRVYGNYGVAGGGGEEINIILMRERIKYIIFF